MRIEGCPARGAEPRNQVLARTKRVTNNSPATPVLSLPLFFYHRNSALTFPIEIPLSVFLPVSPPPLIFSLPHILSPCTCTPLTRLRPSLLRPYTCPEQIFSLYFCASSSTTKTMSGQADPGTGVLPTRQGTASAIAFPRLRPADLPARGLRGPAQSFLPPPGFPRKSPCSRSFSWRFSIITTSMCRLHSPRATRCTLYLLVCSPSQTCFGHASGVVPCFDHLTAPAHCSLPQEPFFRAEPG